MTWDNIATVHKIHLDKKFLILSPPSVVLLKGLNVNNNSVPFSLLFRKENPFPIIRWQTNFSIQMWVESGECRESSTLKAVVDSVKS